MFCYIQWYEIGVSSRLLLQTPTPIFELFRLRFPTLLFYFFRLRLRLRMLLHNFSMVIIFILLVSKQHKICTKQVNGVKKLKTFEVIQETRHKVLIFSTPTPVCDSALHFFFYFDSKLRLRLLNLNNFDSDSKTWGYATPFDSHYRLQFDFASLIKYLLTRKEAKSWNKEKTLEFYRHIWS